MKSATQAIPVVSSDSELLILVDEDDNDIGHLSKQECHAGEGVLHRAFSIFLFTDDGDVLLQRRSPQKLLWPGYWSNACCSHPRYGETMIDAVHRRLAQELDVTANLTYLYKFIYSANYEDIGSEHELCWVWTGTVDADAIAPNENEVEEWQLLSQSELDARLEREPEAFTPWMKMEWSRLQREFPTYLTGD